MLGNSGILAWQVDHVHLSCLSHQRWARAAQECGDHEAPSAPKAGTEPPPRVLVNKPCCSSTHQIASRSAPRRSHTFVCGARTRWRFEQTCAGKRARRDPPPRSRLRQSPTTKGRPLGRPLPWPRASRPTRSRPPSAVRASEAPPSRRGLP